MGTLGAKAEEGGDGQMDGYTSDNGQVSVIYGQFRDSKNNVVGPCLILINFIIYSFIHLSKYYLRRKISLTIVPFNFSLFFTLQKRIWIKFVENYCNHFLISRRSEQLQ